MFVIEHRNGYMIISRVVRGKKANKNLEWKVLLRRTFCKWSFVMKFLQWSVCYLHPEKCWE